MKKELSTILTTLILHTNSWRWLETHKHTSELQVACHPCVLNYIAFSPFIHALIFSKSTLCLIFSNLQHTFLIPKLPHIPCIFSRNNEWTVHVHQNSVPCTNLRTSLLQSCPRSLLLLFCLHFPPPWIIPISNVPSLNTQTCTLHMTPGPVITTLFLAPYFAAHLYDKNIKERSKLYFLKISWRVSIPTVFLKLLFCLGHQWPLLCLILCGQFSILIFFQHYQQHLTHSHLLHFGNFFFTGL